MKATNKNVITSDSRLRIEFVLKGATTPLSCQDVSELAGVPLTLTRTHLGNAVNHGRARNINGFGRPGALYLWGGWEPEAKPRMPAPRFVPAGSYVPTPIHTRAGSDEFLKAPSRTGETLTQYRPPVSMCGEQVSRV